MLSHNFFFPIAHRIQKNMVGLQNISIQIELHRHIRFVDRSRYGIDLYLLFLCCCNVGGNLQNSRGFTRSIRNGIVTTLQPNNTSIFMKPFEFLLLKFTLL